MLVTALPTPLDASARVLVEPAEVGLAGRAVGEGPVAVTGPTVPAPELADAGMARAEDPPAGPGTAAGPSAVPPGSSAVRTARVDARFPSAPAVMARATAPSVPDGCCD